MKVLETRNLTRTYEVGQEKVQALRGVDFEADRGDFIVINGPSGSGKTTFLNMISLIDEPTSGEVYVEGQLVSGLSQAELAVIRRDKIGLMFQTFNLIPVLTAFENIEYPLLLKGVGKKERREKVMSLLKAVDLEKEAHRRPDQLSGGQKQRVALARTLVNDPTIVLADEPTGNLDTKTSERVMEMIANLNKQQGVTFLVVTHDMMVNDYANRLVHIRDGELTELENITKIGLNGSMNGAAKEGVANVVANRAA